jgi:hypothetical protein
MQRISFINPNGRIVKMEKTMEKTEEKSGTRKSLIIVFLVITLALKVIREIFIG